MIKKYKLFLLIHLFQASPKPRTEQWVQEHMNNTIISSDEEMEQQKLNDDYEKRKHLYE